MDSKPTTFAILWIAKLRDRYWQVYFDTNKAIRESFGSAGYPAPETHYCIHQN